MELVEAIEDAFVGEAQVSGDRDLIHTGTNAPCAEGSVYLADRVLCTSAVVLEAAQSNLAQVSSY